MARGGKVLIVDDVPMNVALMSALVAGIEGLEPVGFDDPAAALRWCEQERPVLVLVDFNMPDIDGAQFVTRLRAREEEAIIPVVVVTARTDRDTLLRALDAGASDFIRKPVDEIEVVARVRNLSQLGQASRQLAALATTDELTGLDNRRRFLARLEAETLRARRYGGDLSVVMFDIDHFKRINDTAGHAAGDEVLRDIAARVRALVRDTDFVGRLGGEEFGWALPSTALTDAAGAAERLRRRIADAPFAQGRLVTASLGVATLTGNEDAATLLARADAHLYAAKALGRDRVNDGST